MVRPQQHVWQDCQLGSAKQQILDPVLEQQGPHLLGMGLAWLPVLRVHRQRHLPACAYLPRERGQRKRSLHPSGHQCGARLRKHLLVRNVGVDAAHRVGECRSADAGLHFGQHYSGSGGQAVRRALLPTRRCAGARSRGHHFRGDVQPVGDDECIPLDQQPWPRRRLTAPGYAWLWRLSAVHPIHCAVWQPQSQLPRVFPARD